MAGPMWGHVIGHGIDALFIEINLLLTFYSEIGSKSDIAGFNLYYLKKILTFLLFLNIFKVLSHKLSLIKLIALLHQIVTMSSVEQIWSS